MSTGLIFYFEPSFPAAQASVHLGADRAGGAAARHRARRGAPSPRSLRRKFSDSPARTSVPAKRHVVLSPRRGSRALGEGRTAGRALGRGLEADELGDLEQIY